MSSGRLLIDVFDEREHRRTTVDDDDDDNNDFYEDGDVSEYEITRAQLQREFHDLIKSMTVAQPCLICGNNYLPRNNFLNYYCRIHTGVLYTDGTWSCCDRLRYEAGCRPCLHTTTPEYVASMQRNSTAAIQEIEVEVIDYNLIDFSPDMLINYGTSRGGDVSLIHLADEDGVVKRREGKYYRIYRVRFNERIL